MLINLNLLFCIGYKQILTILVKDYNIIIGKANERTIMDNEDKTNPASHLEHLKQLFDNTMKAIGQELKPGSLDILVNLAALYASAQFMEGKLFGARKAVSATLALAGVNSVPSGKASVK